jgi:aspartyl protease family protein
MRKWIGVLAIIALIGAAVLLISRLGAPGSLDSGDTAMRLVYAAGLITLISGGIVGAFMTKPGAALRDLAIWAGLLLFLVAGYALKEDFALVWQRISGELAPASAQLTSDGGISVQRFEDGHFYIDAEVDNGRIRFLIDTGASMVALSPADARRVGISPDRLDYTMVIQTAAGPSRAAQVRLASLRIGDAEFRDLNAIVMLEGDQSLLGMTVLNQFSSVEVRGDELQLYR